jgi:hypothetical protein
LDFNTKEKAMDQKDQKERRAQELLGDACFKNNMLGDAIEAYKIAGTMHQLSVCGDICMKNEDYPLALVAYLAAGYKDKLFECGNAFVEKKDFKYAKIAFEAVAEIEIGLGGME